MTANSDPASRPVSATLAPVAPSLMVKVVMRPMTLVLNPLIGRMAGRRNFPMAAQIRHVGRRSGRVYVTSAGARVAGDVAVIPLAFGNKCDWARNVRAAGGCSIRANGRNYLATTPEFLDRQAAAPLLASLFSPADRAFFRLLSIKQYLSLHVAPTDAAFDD
jgi:deazaflavin-dependent oxidoreductase (nitroreductase family)